VIGNVVLLGLGSPNLIATLGYAPSGEEAPVQQAPPEHWGHWPLVRRRLGSSSTAYGKDVIEELVEEVEQSFERVEETVKTLPPDWNRILDDALEKIQAKIKAEKIIDLPSRKEERRRAVAFARKELERLEDEEAAIVFLLME